MQIGHHTVEAQFSRRCTGSMTHLIIAVFLLVCLTAPVYGASAGRTAAVFLEMPIGAAPTGMGNAYTAVTNDVHSLWWNPAGLADVDKSQILFMHDEYIADIDHEYVGLASPELIKQHNIVTGLSFNYLDYGSLRRATYTSGNAGTTTGTFGMKDYALGISFAKQNSTQRDFGMTVKYIKQEIDGIADAAWACDIGLKYNIGRAAVRDRFPPLVLGYTLQNLGGDITMERDAFDLPLTHRVGLAFRPRKKLLIAVDGIKTKNGPTEGSAGLEYHLKESLIIRCGYSSERKVKDKYSLGAGFRVSNLAIDYAFTPFSDLGDSHKVSLTYNFGKGPH